MALVYAALNEPDAALAALERAFRERRYHDGGVRHDQEQCVIRCCSSVHAQTLALQALHHESRVTLVSKDINLRIKAAVVGVHAEDYYSDKTIEDADVLYTGLAALPADFWEKAGKDIKSWKEGGRTFYAE